MRLTVGIPARDAEQTLGHVLRAVLAQVEPDDRVLVVDDGSHDRTAEVARRLGAECIAHPHNLGLAAARNTLLAHAATEILLFLDADAIPAPGALRALREGFTEADVAGVGGRGVELDHSTAAARFRAAVTPQDHGPQVIESDWMLMGLCAAFRTDLVRRAGGFNERYRSFGEDADLSLRLRTMGFRLRYLPDAVVYHLHRGGWRDVLRQAYRHTFFAARALAEHGRANDLARFRRDARTNLVHATARAALEGRPAEALAGVANILLRGVALWRGVAAARQSAGPSRS